MTGVATAVVAGAVIGGVVQSRSASKAAKAQERAAEGAIGEQQAARESFEERTEPFREAGLVGAEQLTSFLQDPTQQLEEINPIVSFLRDQGFEQIQESAAASGRLGAGGTLKDLTTFNTQLGTTIVPQLQNQRFNQLFNVASLGANVAAGQGTAGLQTASNIGNLQGNIGAAQAGGAFGQANAITGGIQNVAAGFGAFPNLFGGGGGVPTTATLPSAANPLGQISPTSSQTTVITPAF